MTSTQPSQRRGDLYLSSSNGYFNNTQQTSAHWPKARREHTAMKTYHQFRYCGEESTSIEQGRQQHSEKQSQLQPQAQQEAREVKAKHRNQHRTAPNKPSKRCKCTPSQCKAACKSTRGLESHEKSVKDSSSRKCPNRATR